MAVGDALGTTFEFERIDQPDYPALATGPATAIVGGGPFGLQAGQVTDDTQMAVCIARSLTAKQTVDMLDIATRYIAWFQHAFDVGNQTAAVLKAIEAGADVGTAARAVWHASGRRAAGNGSLMRCAPIGVFCAPLVKHAMLGELVEASLTESLITHADPRCGIACATFNAAIAAGIETPAPNPQNQLQLARTVIPIAAGKLRELYSDNADDVAVVDAAVEDLQRDLDVATADNPGVYRVELDLRRTAGFVRIAFRLAFWHLVHTPSWRDAVVDVASRGGDADTNAAIVGALLGSRDGVRTIPRDWIEQVLAATQPGPAEWAEAHHPKHLLALASMLAA
jgi:ADP-ribosylglycohydrolase